MKSSFSSELLGPILRDVSRSFYLTLAILPAPIRPQIGLAYLLARIADSIADTRLLPTHARTKALLDFRQLLHDPLSEKVDFLTKSLDPILKLPEHASDTTRAEHLLLQKISDAFRLYRGLDSKDRKLVAEVITELTIGMESDLQRFPNDAELASLRTFSELEQYTYHVAGCVGPFWTKMCIRHLPSFQGWHSEKMCELSIRFGKALQWTNILRDISRDLQNGRGYLPSDDLNRFGLTPEHLRQPDFWPKLKPYYNQCLDHTLHHYQVAWEYIRAIPSSNFRMRLACIWPVWIGMKTVALLRRAHNPLDPVHRIRVGRGQVYGIIILSVITLLFPQSQDRYQRRLARLAN